MIKEKNSVGWWLPLLCIQSYYLLIIEERFYSHTYLFFGGLLPLQYFDNFPYNNFHSRDSYKNGILKTPDFSPPTFL